MNFRQKLGYTILGAGLMFIGTIANNFTFSQETLQDGQFHTIKCRSLIVEGNSKDSAYISLLAINEMAFINLKSGNQEITISCIDDLILPLCSIRLEGGLHGGNSIAIQAGEYSETGNLRSFPEFERSHGVYISNTARPKFSEASISVDENGVGRFTARGKYSNKPLWVSPVK